ncbi:MAG: DUF4097 family beta strand repeat-containing protein [Sandaracinaceae bacterium]
MERSWTIVAVLSLVGCVGQPRLVDRSQSSLDIGAETALAFEVGEGDLQILGDDAAETIELTVELKTQWLALRDDDAARDALEVLLEARDGEAFLSVQLIDPPEGYYADVIVTVPSRFDVRGIDDSGDIVIRDVASIDLDDDSGDIVLERIAADVALRDASGDVAVRETGGAIDVTDDSGELELTGIEGSVRIVDGSGGIVVDGADDVTIQDTSGDIRVRARGDVTIEDTSGDIDVDTEGQFEVISDGGGEVHGPRR